MSGRLQRLVGMVLLIVLAGLPVMATTCEALCEQVPAAVSTDEDARAPMHEGMAGCHESPSAPSPPRLTGASSHDCSTHDGGLRETEAARTSSRAAGVVLVATDVPTVAHSVTIDPSVLARSAYSSPPGASSSHAPLVLRV